MTQTPQKFSARTAKFVARSFTRIKAQAALNWLHNQPCQRANYTRLELPSCELLSNKNFSDVSSERLTGICPGKQINAQHWATIQTNLAKAQGTCPVMGKPVDSSMKSTVVNGRKIFVCCPPCIKKINADPATFVAKLDLQIATNTRAAERHYEGVGHDHAAHNHGK